MRATIKGHILDGGGDLVGTESRAVLPGHVAPSLASSRTLWKEQTGTGQDEANLAHHRLAK
jgi:hypothetical protein